MLAEESSAGVKMWGTPWRRRSNHARHPSSARGWPNAGDPGAQRPGKQPDTVRNEVTDQAHKRTCAQLGTRSD